MNILCKNFLFFCVAFTLLGVKAYGAEYTPRLMKKLSSEKTSTILNTGVLHFNHYNTDFEQNFYSIGFKTTEKKVLNGKFNAEGFGLLQVDGDGESVFSLKNAYYSQKINSKLSFDVGRKVSHWSYDEDYKPAGFWNNTWDYSKAFPQTEGLFGAYLNVKASKNVKGFFFISPLSVPKWVSHYDFQNDGSIESLTPWFNLPPTEVTTGGNTFQTRYSLDADIAGVILNPQLGFSFDLKHKKGLFSKVSYLYGPDRDLDLAIDFALDAADESTPVDITVVPRISNVHRMGLEVGKRWSRTSYTVLSANYKLRDSDLPVDLTDRQSHIGLTSGGVYQFLHKTSVYKNLVGLTLHFTENSQTGNDANGELGNLLLDSLSNSFRYRRGYGAALDMKVLKGALSLYGYQDILSDGVLGSVTYNTQFKKLNLRAGLSFVEALSAQSEGFYKDFRRNDSYHVGASYVF